MKTLDQVKEYPKVKHGVKHYLKTPVMKNGKWFAMMVTGKGKFKRPAIHWPYIDKLSCQAVCTGHNQFYGWERSEARKILSQLGVL